MSEPTEDPRIAAWRKQCDEEFAKEVASGEIDRARREMKAGYYYTLDGRLDDWLLPGPAVEQREHWGDADARAAADRAQLGILHGEDE